MKENYYALLLSILSNRTIEESLYEMGLFKPKGTEFLSENDLKRIIRLREQGISWKELAEM